jgi:hypothetical protein
LAGSKFEFAGIASLEALRLGIIESYSYDDILDDYIKKAHASSRSAARMLCRS